MNTILDQGKSIEMWLEAVARRIDHDAPDLRRIFDVYAGEARFGRQFIAEDLGRLPHSARLLEVGAGACLLSCQLVREGFQVTALEPVSDGFSHFSRLRSIVLDIAEKMGCSPRALSIQAEDFNEQGRYDFAFSINVMEHVRDVEAVIDRVADSLRPGADYHFTCPNYAFPYEPHFSMPTLLSKRLTEWFMGRYIFHCSKLPDPAGTWRSLNWITVTKIAKSVRRRRPALRVRFDRHLLIITLERIIRDPQFAARHGRFLQRGISMLVRIGLHRVPALLPASILPIIDCRIKKLEQL